MHQGAGACGVSGFFKEGEVRIVNTSDSEKCEAKKDRNAAGSRGSNIAEVIVVVHG
jgi:hypothetical protein